MTKLGVLDFVVGLLFPELLSLYIYFFFAFLLKLLTSEFSNISSIYKWILVLSV